MRKFVSRAGPVLACLVAMVFVATAAQASQVDFGCGAGTLTLCGAGTLSVSGMAASTSGTTTVEETIGPTLDGPFDLSFTTTAAGTGTIDLTGTGADTGIDLRGDVTATIAVPGPPNTDVILTAVWPASGLPASYQTWLGSPDGIDTAIAISLTSTGTIENAGVNIDPTPEPASVLLFGLGLLAFGIFLKRRPQHYIAV